MRAPAIGPTPLALRSAAGLTLVLLLLAGCGGDVRYGGAPEGESPGDGGDTAATENPAVQEGFDALVAGDPEAARARFVTVTPGSSGYPRALQGLAILALQEDRPARALELLDVLVQLTPDDADAWVLLGRARFRLERLSDAETAALHAIELDPERVDARYDVALYRLQQDRLTDALPSYGRAMNLDYDTSGSLRAIANLKALREETPDDPEIALALAFFAKARNDRGTEREELRRYLDLAPDGPAAAGARERLEELDAPS